MENNFLYSPCGTKIINLKLVELIKLNFDTVIFVFKDSNTTIKFKDNKSARDYFDRLNNRLAITI
jgi:hypothetical protein